MMLKTFAVENAVDPEVHVYVPRAQDEELMRDVRDSFLTHVQGSRMSGKSSLLMRARMRLREQGVVTAYADLHTLVIAGPSSPLDSMRTLIATLARRAQLELPAAASDDSVRTPADLLAASLGELADGCTATGGLRLVLLLDELDAIAAAPWVAGFFASLNDISIRRRDDGSLDGVRVVLAGVRPVRHLVDDVTASSVAAPDATMWLDEFANDASSVTALQAGFPDALRNHAQSLAWKALEFSGGYPQACTWLCRQMISEQMADGLDDLEGRLSRLAERERRSPSPPLFFDFPENYVRSYASGRRTVADPNPQGTAVAALWIYLDLLAGYHPAFDTAEPAHLLLRWTGLARVDQTGVLRVRSPLLEHFYTIDWVHRVRRLIDLGLAARARSDATPRRSAARPLVAVLTTGGTMGMVEDDTGKVRAPHNMRELTDAYREVEAAADVEWSAVLGEMRDSSDVLPEHWRQIAFSIAEHVRDPRIAGVVVTHGTDTLVYTASAVAFALGARLTKPVVFTGSQATVDVAHGDARLNLLRACKVAAESGGRLPEVVVCFGDKVLRACRAEKRDDRRFDAFASPLCPPLAIVTEELEYADAELRRHRGTPPPLDLRADFDSRLLTITQVPGLRTELLQPLLDADQVQDSLGGIIVQSLGAGNLPTAPGYSLVSFIARAVALDIPVVLTSPYPVLMGNPHKYAPSEAAIRAGALPLFNITLPALVTKFAWILGGMPRDLRHAPADEGRRGAWVAEHIRTNYIGESDDEPTYDDVVDRPSLPPYVPPRRSQ